MKKNLVMYNVEESSRDDGKERQEEGKKKCRNNTGTSIKK